MKFGSRDLMVKQLLPELAENPRLVEQCVLRAQRAKHLRHVGIAEVMDVLVEGDRCYIVTELLEGFCLRDILDRVQGGENALPVWFSLQLARQLSRALQYAHELGPEWSGPHHHQDVSPANILLTTTGQAKLVDFGLTRAALLGTDAVGFGGWSDSGEFDLWAPHFGDVQTDIIGLAKVLYEMLAGRPMGRRFVPPSKHAPWVSPELDQLLSRALGLPGPDRFTTMREFRGSLAAVIRRQRHQADSSHLAGLLRVVMSSFQNPEAEQPESRVVTPPSPAGRTETILPGPMSPEEQAEEIALAARSNRSGLEDRASKACAWDAAVERMRRESERPPRDDTTECQPMLPSALIDSPSSSEVAVSANDSFERGLEWMRLGDLSLAEAAWQKALELDPNHRLCQINLRLLRKRRDSERLFGG